MAEAADLVFWQTNAGLPVQPPPDSTEWIAVIRSVVPDHVRVVLVDDERGGWFLSTAEELPVLLGSGPWSREEMTPTDHRAPVAAALRSAGKTVRD